MIVWFHMRQSQKRRKALVCQRLTLSKTIFFSRILFYHSISKLTALPWKYFRLLQLFTKFSTENCKEKRNKIERSLISHEPKKEVDMGLPTVFDWQVSSGFLWPDKVTQAYLLEKSAMFMLGHCIISRTYTKTARIYNWIKHSSST